MKITAHPDARVNWRKRGEHRIALRIGGLTIGMTTTEATQLADKLVDAAERADRA